MDNDPRSASPPDPRGHRLVLERLPSVTTADPRVWLRVVTLLSSWPAGERARPGLERRFWRNTSRGRLTETVVVSVVDPLGMMSPASTRRETAELARPLRDALALRELTPARLDAFDALPHAHFAQLTSLDRATADVRPVLAWVFADLLAGLEAVPGPVALSLIAAPPLELEPDDDEVDAASRTGDAPREVAFCVTLAGAAEIPAALRARVEAVCCDGPARSETWRVSRGETQADVCRVALREHRLGALPATNADALVAAVTLGTGVLPGEARTVVGRPVAGALPRSGAPLGRVPRPNGRLVPLRLDWQTRTHHLLLIGGSGAGKSTMIKRLVFDDLEHGRGVIVVDPHGDLAHELSSVLAHRPGTLYVDPRESDPRPLDLLHPDPRRADVAIQSAMAELWPPEFTGPVFQRHVSVALRVLAKAGHPLTFAALDAWFSSFGFRQARLDEIDDDDLIAEAKPLHHSLSKPSSDDLPVSNYLASKFSPFVHGPAHAVFDRADSVTWEARIAGGDACVVCLPTGMLGDAGARMAGRVLLSRLGQALAAQGERAADERHPCSLIVDEAHLFAGQALAGLYTQVRKFGGSVTTATQAPSQLGGQRDLVLSNVGTVVAGRVARAEAAVLHDRAGDSTVALLPKLPRWHMALIDADHDPSTLAPVLSPLPLPDDRGAQAAVSRRVRSPSGSVAARREARAKL